MTIQEMFARPWRRTASVSDEKTSETDLSLHRTNTKDMTALTLMQEWDKTFPKSERVNPCKELYIIPGASHVDLYDDVAGIIPYDKMEAFFRENLK